MCTTSEIPQIFHTNHSNILDIKEESEGYDAITFEDYKITENYSNEIIKEEPVDCYEIVELTDVVGIYPNERSTKFSDAGALVLGSKSNLDIENYNQTYNDNRQSCSEDEEFTKKFKSKLGDFSEHSEYKLEDCESKSIKLEQISPKWLPINHINDQKAKEFDKKLTSEQDINLKIIKKNFSVKDLKSFLIHDHSYHQTLNTPILNKFDSEDDGESSQEDNEMEINSKIEANSSKMHNISNSKRASLENLENLSSNQSENDSSSESDESMDEDEDGIQYKEVSPNKFIDTMKKSRSLSENSEDDHDCYTKNSTKIRRQSRVNCDIRINDAMDLKRCFEISSSKLRSSSNIVSRKSSSVESEMSDLGPSEFSGTNQSKLQEVANRLRNLHRLSPNLPQLRRKSQQIYKNPQKICQNSRQIPKNSPQPRQNSAQPHQNSQFPTNFQQIQSLGSKVSQNSPQIIQNPPKIRPNSRQIPKNSPQTHQNSTQTHENSQFPRNLAQNQPLASKVSQISSEIIQNPPKIRPNSRQIQKNLPQPNIVVLLTDSSNSDSETLESPQTVKKSPPPPISFNPLKCPDCPTVFQDTLRLNRHKRTHQVPQFQCRSCLRKFKRKSMLKKHFCDIKCTTCPDICTCQMDDSKDCIICQKINFRYFVDYKEHMLTQHNEIVYCKICEKNNFTLNRHKQLKHEVVRSFRCTECTSILKSKEQLDYHMEIHAKNFSCSKCSKVFTRRYLLNQHELTHENPEQFHCDICDKNFQRKFCLDKHRKVIHSDKNKEEDYLRKHRGMNGGKSAGWIKCGKCPAMFRSRESRQKHLGQAH